jgi:hypothetical protein
VSSSRKARVDVRSPLAAVEFALLDSSLRQVASGVGGLDARVEPGLYQLEVRAGPRVDSELLKLAPGEVHRDLGVSLEFPSAAPIEGTTTSQEVQQQAALEGSERVAAEAGPPAGLVVVVRNVRGQEETALNRRTTNRLSLFDQELRPVESFRRSWQLDGAQGWATWSHRLEPGGYVLRSRYRRGSHSPAATIDQSLWLSPGWQTLIFIPNTSVGPASGIASIHMTDVEERWAPGWDPQSQEAGNALEIALWGLREGRSVLPDDLLGLLLGAKFSNPMLGIVGAHSLLLEPRFDVPRFETVMRNLRSLVPEHPDVAALSWLGIEARRGPARRRTTAFPTIEVGWPPMLAASYSGLVRLDALARGGVVTGSVAEAIAANLVVRGVWTSWRALPTPGRAASARPRPRAAKSAPKRPASKAIPKRSSRARDSRGSQASPARARRVGPLAAAVATAAAGSATERVEVYVEEVRRVHGVGTRGEAVEAAGHDQISVATGLPVSSVQRALKGLGNAWLRS